MISAAPQSIYRSTRTLHITAIAAVIIIVIGIIVYYLSKSWIVSAVAILVSTGLTAFIMVANKRLKRDAEVKKMEFVFPDFLEMMSSNLRAGMTIDRALLTSAREEFSPLDKEILKLGKDLVTGKEIEHALNDMANRINSERIKKTLMLIISGIRSGGNLATLLQETASNVRERAFVEKRAASSVLMYVIFICFAIAVGAPLLFSLSTVLVGTLSNILSTLPPIDAGAQQLPFTLTKIAITPEFVTYYAVLFILVTNLLGCLVLGMVGKGDEKAGIKYFVPLVVVSLLVFFGVKTILSSYFGGLFS